MSGSDADRTESRIDPSTNMDPLQEVDGDAILTHHPSNPEDMAKAQKEKKKKRQKDVSKHTFYISNSQTRIKLYAKNEVCFFTRFGEPNVR